MRYLFALALLTSCGSLPQFYQSIEDIADNDAVSVSLSKDALKKDCVISVEIKDEPGAK